MVTSESSVTIRPAWSSYFVFYTAAALFLLGPQVNPQYAPYRTEGLVICGLIAAFVILRRSTTAYTWTDGVLIVNNGIPGGRDEEIPFANIDSVELRRGLTQSALGIGNLALHLKSPQGEVRVLYGVRNPKGLRDRILKRAGASSGVE